jgi:hypothetical protein
MWAAAVVAGGGGGGGASARAAEWPANSRKAAWQQMVAKGFIRARQKVAENGS